MGNVMQISKRMKDLSGQQFGSLTAIAPDHYTNGKTIVWKFQCVCGKEHMARGNTVANIAKKGDPELPSCGCIELARKTKHGFRKANDTHPLYGVWKGIKDRCHNPKSPLYPTYGAQGVTMCEEWLESPQEFIRWGLETGWEEGQHLDKDILCDCLGISPKQYAPHTCQWLSVKDNVTYSIDRRNYGKLKNIRLSQSQVDEIIHLYFSGQITNQSELARMYGLKSPSSVRRLIELHKEGLG